MCPLLSKLSFVLRTFRRHPLTRDRVCSAVCRYAKWQVGSRLVPGPVVVPWVHPCRLVMKAGMWGATMNHYCGLQDYESMCFLLHVLRREDVFLDVGANVGVYSVLAAGVVGAETIAVEPGGMASVSLLANLRVNGLEHRVQLVRDAVGAAPGVMPFTRGLDTLNHIVTGSGPSEGQVEVRVTTIDALLEGGCPQLIKLDTEGYETPAVEGAMETLGKAQLLGLLVELDGHGRRYGFDEAALHRRFLEFGFFPHTYRPDDRVLERVVEGSQPVGNVLYLRVAALDEIQQRLVDAPPFTVLGRRI